MGHMNHEFKNLHSTGKITKNASDDDNLPKSKYPNIKTHKKYVI